MIFFQYGARILSLEYVNPAYASDCNCLAQLSHFGSIFIPPFILSSQETYFFGPVAIGKFSKKKAPIKDATFQPILT
jgi:hypothetical protein